MKRVEELLDVSLRNVAGTERENQVKSVCVLGIPSTTTLEVEGWGGGVGWKGVVLLIHGIRSTARLGGCTLLYLYVSLYSLPRVQSPYYPIRLRGVGDTNQPTYYRIVNLKCFHLE